MFEVECGRRCLGVQRPFRNPGCPVAVGLGAIWDDAGFGPERKMATQVPASPLKKGEDTRVLSDDGLWLWWQEGALTDGG